MGRATNFLMAFLLHLKQKLKMKFLQKSEA